MNSIPSCPRAWDNTQHPPSRDPRSPVHPGNPRDKHPPTHKHRGTWIGLKLSLEQSLTHQFVSQPSPWTTTFNQLGCACIICCSLAHTHLSFSHSLLPISIHIFHFCKGKAECYSRFVSLHKHIRHLLNANLNK